MRRLLLAGLLRRASSSPSSHHHLHLVRAFSASSPLPASDADLRKYAGYALLLVGCGAATYYSFPLPPDALHKKAVPFKYAPLPDDLHAVSNWSATHEVHTRVLLQPDSLLALHDALAAAHGERRKLRPLGSGLSPNGLALSRAGMVNLALMDKVLDVDAKKKTVTVQAGIRVAELVDALREHGLTLSAAAPPPTTPSRFPPTRSTRRPSPSSTRRSPTTSTPATHEVHTRVLLQPDSLPALHDALAAAHGEHRKLRPLGSGLSPNGLALSRAGMVNLALMDKVLDVDAKKKTVTVQAGIRVAELVDALREHGLTLQNFASIREQQVGGIIQVGAHGTGARLPPIDEQVISMKLVTPAKGTIELSREKDPDLFYLARCGLGGLGVVAELLLSNAILLQGGELQSLPQNMERMRLYNMFVIFIMLFRTKAESNDPEVDQLSFTELRDRLLALDPLDKDHVIRINKAEAEYWKKSEGYRMGWSDEILGFDCGGQQWVSETCFPAGTLAKPNMKDLDYIEELLQLIEKEDIPAPAPIEQRWTACSRSPMSPASSSQEDDIFSWVGIIMYLPTSDARQRKEIMEEFFNYRSKTQTNLWDGYSAYEHWAKIEVPKDKDELAELQARLRKRFPVDAYNKARMELDPNKVLSNAKLEKLFPVTEVQHAK
uniref:FAD-binding PCMH-type domain-containing protein n=1 Tax=Oryza meridionalis TaxID=40149 RepID=A0A0E0F9F1_9ORYZ